MPRERILAAALELVDAEGSDALSMRTLAQRLDSGTATLYRHFANRAQLIAEIVDRVLGEVDLTWQLPVDRPWQEACETFATAMYNALGRHPNVARLLLEHTPFGPNAMALREQCLSMLARNQFSPELAARSYATIARFVLGFAIQLSGHPEQHAAADDDAFRSIDPSQFPATLAVADTLPVPLDDEFAFGLKLIIEGLTQIR